VVVWLRLLAVSGFFGYLLRLGCGWFAGMGVLFRVGLSLMIRGGLISGCLEWLWVMMDFSV